MDVPRSRIRSVLRPEIRPIKDVHAGVDPRRDAVFPHVDPINETIPDADRAVLRGVRRHDERQTGGSIGLHVPPSEVSNHGRVDDVVPVDDEKLVIDVVGRVLEGMAAAQLRLLGHVRDLHIETTIEVNV